MQQLYKIFVTKSIDVGFFAFDMLLVDFTEASQSDPAITSMNSAGEIRIGRFIK